MNTITFETRKLGNGNWLPVEIEKDESGTIVRETKFQECSSKAAAERINDAAGKNFAKFRSRS